MKTLIILLCLLSNTLFAQSRYEQGMTQALSLWKTGENEKAAAMLERISQTEKNNWIPRYYQAMIMITASFNAKDSDVQGKYIQDAETILSDHQQDNNAEWLVLRAMSKTAELVTDPMTKAKELSPIITALYKKALAIAPENPRARIGLAEFQFQSKKYFNQDTSQECEEAQKALSLFEKERRIDTPFAPSWGKDRAEKLLKACK